MRQSARFLAIGPKADSQYLMNHACRIRML